MVNEIPLKSPLHLTSQTHLACLAEYSQLSLDSLRQNPPQQPNPLLFYGFPHIYLRVDLASAIRHELQNEPQASITSKRGTQPSSYPTNQPTNHL